MTTQPVNPKDTTPRSEPATDCPDTPTWFLRAAELKLAEVLKILETADLGKLNKPLLWANAISAARVTIYRFMKQNDIKPYTEEQLRKTGNTWNRNHYETEKAALLEKVVKPFTSDVPSEVQASVEKKIGGETLKCEGCERVVDELTVDSDGVEICKDCYIATLEDALERAAVLYEEAQTDEKASVTPSTPTASLSESALSQLRVEKKIGGEL